jgi:hypothetical protein
MLIHNAEVTGSLKINNVPFNSGSFSGSFQGDGSQLSGITGALTASYVEYSNVGNKPALVSGSEQITYSGLSGIPSGIVSGSSQVSFNGIVDKPTLVSGSSQVTYGGLSGIPAGIVSGSAQVAALGFATTGSNTFQANQVITGSLFITQNLVVAGSSSIQYISSSVLDIADNIITVNAFNPGVRFGGLAVVDSGSSPQVSGSLLFDSIKDQWIFIHETPGTITSSVLLMGPETYNDLGNETYLSVNRLSKGTGIEHLRDSNITDTGTIVSINSNTQVTGSFTVITGSAVELQVTNTGVNIGSISTDNHNVTGSLRVTGSMAVTGAGTFSSSVTAGGNFLMPAGSGLAWSGDATRIITPEDNISGALIQTPGIVRFNIGGTTERVRITAGGALLVGTTNTYSNLATQGDIVLQDKLIFGADQTGSADNRNWSIETNSSQNGSFDIVNSSANNNWPNAAYRLSLTRGGTLGLGVTPSAWSDGPVLQVGNAGLASRTVLPSLMQLSANQYWDGSNHRRISDGLATLYTQNIGGHNWDTVSSGLANSVITWTQAMTLTPSGNLGIGSTSPQGLLQIGVNALSNNSDASNAFNLKQTSTTAATGIYLERSGERKGYYIYLGGSLDSLTFQRNNAGTKADVMSLTRDGNVGISTDSPNEKLQVSGAISATGTATTAFASSATMDYFSGATRFISRGGNNSTRGAYRFLSEAADGSLSIDALSITSGGHVGIRISPNSGWGSAMAALQIGTGGVIDNWTGTNSVMSVGVNYYDNGSGAQIRLYANSASKIGFSGNVISFSNAASSSAGSNITWAERMSITSTGTVQPGANGTQDLGTSSLRWATVFTSDLSLSNGIGDYTIVEGENDLFLYNNKQNKVYKFLVEEVDPSTATPKKS